MTISSSKYKDIISKSIRIHAGPPAVYQLIPKKEKFGTLIRMTVGEKNPKQPNKTILLVGETGAGKSTLINALFNYTMGVKWEDGVWFQITEQKKESQSESQTSDVIVYEIFGFEDETLTIIDTPGYGDTKGIQRDVIIQQRLFDLFRSEDGVHEIHVVGLVVKASDNRVSDRLRYIFDSVMSLFGKNLEKNIICLFTHSNGRKPKNAIAALEASKVKCARNKGNQPVYFLFDNCQHEDRTEEEEDCEYSDLISEKGMRAFTVFLKNTEQQKLEITLEVLNERVRLTACIQNLQERIKLTELKQKEKKQIREVIEKYEDEEVKKQTSTVEIDEVYKDKENITGGMWGLVFYEGAVCCTVCEETCHYPGCTMAWKPEHCEVMKKGHCTVCTNKCPASKHVKEKWRYVIKTNKIKMTEADIKKKYESSEHLRNEIKQLTKEKSKLLDESYQHVIRLEEIALNVNSLSTFVHLDFLIEKMKEKEDKEKVQKLEKIKGRIDKETIASLQDILRNLREQGKSMA